jgi:hypothetical protein
VAYANQDLTPAGNPADLFSYLVGYQARRAVSRSSTSTLKDGLRSH